jgi:formate hydrogenlyase subunit 3/multisubunit Na+/H+ antiporter MnhD subunit
MNRMAVLFVVLLAAALACATLALASLFFGSLLAWSQSLSPMEAKLLQPSLLVFAALLGGLAVYVRRRRGQSSGEL